MRTIPNPARILVCGTGYGSSYLRALSGAHGGGAHAVGILGRGGASSRGHAQQLRLPYYTRPEEVPADAVDAVCVAVGHGAGVELTRAFLERGWPVISEHPMRGDVVAELQGVARAAGVPWHLNSHFADLPCVEPLVSGCHRLASADAAGGAGAGRWVYVHATTNPRTLFSLVDILARALGPLGQRHQGQGQQRQGGVPGWQPGPWQTLPPVDQGRDFLVTVAGALAGVPALVSCQRTASVHDDGSATLVGHHLEIAHPQGVLELADTFGPVVWRPNSSAHPGQGPVWSTFPAGPPPDLGQIQAQRDGANRRALELLLQQARGAPPPSHQQPDHQLGVARTWDTLLAAIGPPVVIPVGSDPFAVPTEP